MGFSAHTKRLYEFFKEQEMKFIFDDTDNFYDALVRRENRKKEAILTMKAEIVEQTGLELSTG